MDKLRIDDFPQGRYGTAWEWMEQNPTANRDDFGPQTLLELAVELDNRRNAGESLYGVWTDSGTVDARLVGLIGWRRMGPRWAMLHGICFDESVHGTGLARRAVRMVLAWMFHQDVDKISAWYFADNERIRRFLAKLGAVDEGYLRRQTVRDGAPLDMRLVAFFKDEFLRGI